MFYQFLELRINYFFYQYLFDKCKLMDIIKLV